MHLRPRTRSQMTIWNLPEELILYIVKGLHIRDILNLKAVSYIYIYELLLFVNTNVLIMMVL